MVPGAGAWFAKPFVNQLLWGLLYPLPPDSSSFSPLLTPSFKGTNIEAAGEEEGTPGCVKAGGSAASNLTPTLQGFKNCEKRAQGTWQQEGVGVSGFSKGLAQKPDASGR